MGPYLLWGLEGVGFRAVLGFGAFGFQVSAVSWTSAHLVA